jgi:hypothetical protein
MGRYTAVGTFHRFTTRPFTTNRNTPNAFNNFFILSFLLTARATCAPAEQLSFSLSPLHAIYTLHRIALSLPLLSSHNKTQSRPRARSNSANRQKKHKGKTLVVPVT